MVKIRLTRMGSKKSPFYRVQAIDERKRRDGRPIEYLGTYDPRVDPPALKVDFESVDAWVAKGAQMSESVASLVKKARKAAAAAEGA